MTPTATRLSSDRYLGLIEQDGSRIAVLADGQLAAAVPTCPGWDVADAVRHTGSVFHHKVAGLRLGRLPTGDEWSHGPSEGEDLIAWYRAALVDLLGELAARAPGDPAPTWYPPEQTVGFWQRRMAHEAAVHRVDVEAAVGSLTPVDDDLALDGIDEVLEVFLGYGMGADPDEDVSVLEGRSVLVRSGPHAWLVTASVTDPGERIRLDRAAGPARATVSGEPSELLLWLWGRRPDAAVHVAGDPAAASALRTLLARATG